MSNRYELIGYCSYRDKETGKVSDNFVGVLNEQDQQITELEAKLAESEKIGKGFIELYEKEQHKNYELFKEVNQLKQQLAEKDGEIERLKQNYDEVWEDTYFSVREDFELNNNCNECRRCYAEEFSKQLAEKESLLEKIMSGEYIPANIAEKSLKLRNQAIIAELEKVKDKTDALMFKINNMNYFIMVKEELYDFIDQQIKKLKGEK